MRKHVLPSAGIRTHGPQIHKEVAMTSVQFYSIAYYLTLLFNIMSLPQGGELCPQGGISTPGVNTL
jgi:hypothetical protein